MRMRELMEEDDSPKGEVEFIKGGRRSGGAYGK